MDIARDLFQHLRSRVNHRIQIIADGHASYLDAVPREFGGEVDFAMLVKLYGQENHVAHVSGRPEPGTINACYVERHNWTMRTMQRFTRQSNGLSRKLRNHMAMVALWMFAYNLCHTHRGLKRKGQAARTPAIAAGVTDWPMKLDTVVELVDAAYEKELMASDAGRWPAA